MNVEMMSNLARFFIQRERKQHSLLAYSKSSDHNYQSCTSQVYILMNILFGSVVLDLSQRQFDMYLPKSVASQNVFLLLVLNGLFTSNRISAVGLFLFCSSFTFWESQFSQYF